jgi:hypothetical protein
VTLPEIEPTTFRLVAYIVYISGLELLKYCFDIAGDYN